MAALIREAHDLILNRGAVARSGALNHPCEEGRAVQVGADDLMGPLIRVGDVADHLIAQGAFIGVGRKRNDPLVARLNLKPGKINRAPVDPRRGSGFEAVHRKPEGPEAIPQRVCRVAAVGAGFL